MRNLFLFLSVFFQFYRMSAMFVEESFFTYFQVKDDSSWSARTYNLFANGSVPDSVFVTAGAWTIRFELSEDVKDKVAFEDVKCFLGLDCGKSLQVSVFNLSNEPIALLDVEGNLPIKPSGDTVVLQSYSNGSLFNDTLIFGDAVYFPALGGTKAYNCQLSDCGFKTYWYSEEGKENIYPVTLKGKVYGSNGALLEGYTLYTHNSAETGYPCSNTSLGVDAGGFYELRLQYPVSVINELIYASSEYQIAPSWGKIQLITLKDTPFGSEVEADIHFFDELSAIDEQTAELFWLKNGKLQFSEEVSKGEIVNMQGRCILSGADCLSLPNLPAGMYCMKAELTNGKQVCQKLYIH